MGDEGNESGGYSDRAGKNGEFLCIIFIFFSLLALGSVVADEKRQVGVYMQGSWQIYYTNWKTKKGRFAYLAKKEKEKGKRRNKEGERAKKDGDKEKEKEREKKNPALFLATRPSGSAAGEFTYSQNLAMTKPPRKRARVLTSKHSFTEDEERAMAAHVVNNGLTTVLPSYLTWQTWSENPEGVSVCFHKQS